MLRSVHPSGLPDVWETVEPWLREIVEKSNGQMTLRQVAEYIVKAYYQLWIIEDEEPIAAGLTQFVTFPSGLQECEIVGIYGKDMAKWLPDIEALVEKVKAEGVPRIRAPSRPGFEKLLKPYGFKKSHVNMVLEL